MIFCCMQSLPGFSGDWPMWRYGPNRGAASDEDLADTLHLQWVREYPSPRPAWPPQSSLRFDASYQPVVLGRKVFIASSVNDSVSALDIETGKREWIFYTGGPVRFAPAGYSGRIFFASDDGYFYCVNAETGEIVWKFNGAPADRSVLGNGRLISMWPARGGPVLKNGTVYFAAGIWPFMGVSLYALEADTGNVIWKNEKSGYLFIKQPHSGSAFSGCAPQGYLAAAGDMLLVPNGRAKPACFNRKTGEFIYFHHGGWRYAGGCEVWASGKYFFNGGRTYDLETGKTRKELSPPSVISGNTGFVKRYRDLAAFDLASGRIRVVTRKGRKRKLFSFSEIMNINIRFTPFIKAGRCLYGTDRDGLVAVNVSTKTPACTWRAKIPGTAGSMIAAGGKLIVASLEGTVYCFGSEKKEVIKHPYQRKPGSENDSWSGKAGDILKKTGVREGYAVVLRIGSGRLIEELAKQSRLQVIGLDPDPKKISFFRKRFDKRGIYGTRVSLKQGSILSAGLPPYLADLVVSEDPDKTVPPEKELFLEKIFSILRPYGGTACLDIPFDAETINKIKLPGAEVTKTDGFTLIMRKGPLAGSGQWTHQNADACNTRVSHDLLVKAPLGLLWFGGSTNTAILPRHGRGPVPQIIGGRLFIEGPDILRALDVYTGRILWETELPGIGKPYNNVKHQPGADALGANYVSCRDTIYAAHKNKCLLLDPATGQPRAEPFVLRENKKDAPQAWGYIGVWKDLLIAGAGPIIYEGKRPVGTMGNWDAICSRRITVMDRQTGKVLWKRDALQAFRHNAIAAGNGMVFCIDRHPDPALEIMKRKNIPVQRPARLLALDAYTGKTVWKTEDNVFGTWLAYSEEHNLLVQSRKPGPGRDTLRDENDRKYRRMSVFNGKNGKRVWADPSRGYGGRPIIHGTRIIVRGFAIDLRTGETITAKDPITGSTVPWLYSGISNCSSFNASEYLLTFRAAAAGYFDLLSSSGTANLGGFKSGCTANLVAADGVLNAPDYTRTCGCVYQNQCSLAAVHMPDIDMWTFSPYKSSPAEIKKIGINFGAPGDRKAEDGVLWVEYPVVGGNSPSITVRTEPENPHLFYTHTLRIRGKGLPWVAGSGAEGITSAAAGLSPQGSKPRVFTISLYFCETADISAGDRVFDIRVQNAPPVRGVDILKETGAKNTILIKEFRNIRINGELNVKLIPVKGLPVLCGIRAVEEK